MDVQVRTQAINGLFSGNTADDALPTVNNYVHDFELLSIPAPVEIGDRVWYDADKNGLQDPDEPGLANVTVALRDPAGNIITATTVRSHVSNILLKLNVSNRTQAAMAAQERRIV